jgi:lipoprotein-anchoring transpeptidase ErfK/SrfK
MTRAWSRLFRIGLVSLAAPLLLLHGGSTLMSASAPNHSLGATARSSRAHPDAVSSFAGAPTRALRSVLSGVGYGLESQSMVAQALQPVKPRRPRRPMPYLLVRLNRSLQATSRPGRGKVVGIVPLGSKYYRTRTVAWVMELSADNRYGRVSIPYTSRPKTGWIRLRGLKRSHTPYLVSADLSSHRLTVRKLGRVLFRAPMATGAPWSPTPPGRYFVTDRVPFDPRGPLGAFAFGISGIQTRLPPGWHGGNQLAIHGTNNPGSIGRSVSAGCLRVARAALERLKRILILGTPVVIQR